MDVFFTIIAGVLVFTSSQYVLKLVIEPALELKKVLRSVSHIILLYQAILTNAIPNSKVVDQLSDRSAEMISACEQIVGYKLFRLFFNLPPKNNISKAAREMNLLAFGIGEAANDIKKYQYNTVDLPIQNSECIKRIGTLLGVSTTYTGREKS